MKVSQQWLQNFFNDPLPSVPELVDALTFHVAEVEEVTETFIDVKVLPDRAAYLLSHRGVAFELAAVLGVHLKSDPLREPLQTFPTTDSLSITIEDDKKCCRYIGAVVRGVKVGPSPAWLKEALEAIGQRSINNVVDATNYVMLNIGQPLHAFDAKKLSEKDGAYAIKVRSAHDGEKITTLTGEEYTLTKDILVITDGHTNAPIGVAGVKGGKAAEITSDTTDIIVEAANFDGTLVRKASQSLKLWTDASQRFQNRPSPELAAYAMRDVLKLITDIAGGTIEGVVDVYPSPATTTPVSVTLSKINAVLGTDYTLAHVANVFQAFGFPYLNEDDLFTVTPPFERRDIVIPEDLIEEVGRILGYDNIVPETLPKLPQAPDQKRFHGIELIKDFMTRQGYTEISTQTFSEVGEVKLANPLDQTRPALRTNLSENMQEALTRAVNVAPRVLGPVKHVRLFEIGKVFKKDDEHLSLAFGIAFLEKKKASMLQETVSALQDEFGMTVNDFKTEGTIAEISLASIDLENLSAHKSDENSLRRVSLGEYHPFSIYPFAIRDIAVWTPDGTEENEVATLIQREGGDLLARMDLFDRFSKETDGVSRTSYAFRLVFESFERTLSDEDLNPLMEKITAALNANDGWEVR